MTKTAMLGKLRTDLGDRTLYDSVSQCNRCGYCEQVCPTYVLTGREAFSGRGRNQLARMLLEGRFRNPQDAEEALSTCLLCSACTSACYAHVATADHVLEGRRRLRGGRLHWLAAFLMDLLADRPERFRLLLKIGYAFKRLGFSRLAASQGLLRLLGFGVLEAAELHADDAPPARFLEEELAEDASLALPRPSGQDPPAWYYFAPCGPNFFLTRVGKATVKVLKRLYGSGAFLKNGCCGLLHYNYGDLSQAKDLARRTIELAEKEASSGGPIIGDCSSCVAHMKTYPQLFLDEPQWRERAEAFAARVRDASEMYLPEKLSAFSGQPSATEGAQEHRSTRTQVKPQFDTRHPTFDISNPQPPSPLRELRPSGTPAGTRSRAEGATPVFVTYHDSCRARNAQGIEGAPKAAMRVLFGDRYRPLPESQWCCGGAGAFAFVHPELSRDVTKRKISNIARMQSKVVATSATSCLLQLAYGLKKYYPECRAVHLSELVAEKLAENEP